MPIVKFLEPVAESEEKGYVTSCESYAAIPFVKGKFVVIHNGYQIKTCKNLTEAKKFISKELKK